MKRKQYSTTKQAKNLIRGEIRHFYGNQVTGTKRKPIDVMREDADNYNAGEIPRIKLTDRRKGAGLVDAGCFRIYHDDQAKFLERIYGKEKVARWSGTKCHMIYRDLVGREYDAMLREGRRAKAARKKRI